MNGYAKKPLCTSWDRCDWSQRSHDTRASLVEWSVFCCAHWTQRATDCDAAQPLGCARGTQVGGHQMTYTQDNGAPAQLYYYKRLDWRCLKYSFWCKRSVYPVAFFGMIANCYVLHQPHQTDLRTLSILETYSWLEKNSHTCDQNVFSRDTTTRHERSLDHVSENREECV